MEKEEVVREIVVDGSGQILGRLASIVAKKLLEGYRVTVVNVEKIVISGKPSEVVKSYKSTVLTVRSHHAHKWRPKRPRSPINIFKSSVKGMLPKNNKRGREALKRLKAYIGVPEEFKGKELVRFKEADASRLGRWYVELERVSRELGWKGGRQ
ncbi:MAG: 50S ribosomal protein L13 [Desulfurococcales archaeon]|nr:50S ribosomal protein L13 [Desulfurococcales archaeon]